MTERELFAAYRTPAGYSAQCACGSWVSARAGSGEIGVSEAVRIHNESPDHQQWREEQKAVEAMKRPTRHRCPCCSHGETA